MPCRSIAAISSRWAATALAPASFRSHMPHRPRPISALGVDAAHSACAPAAPTTRAARSSAPSRRPHATARRSRSRRAAIASAICGCQPGAHLIGVRGATKLLISDGASLIAADRRGTRHAVRPGARRHAPSPARAARPDPSRQARRLRIVDCEIMSAGGTGIHCIAVDGEIAGTQITDSADVAIHSLRRPRPGDRAQHHQPAPATTASRSGAASPATTAPSSATTASRTIENRSGGSGQYGNAVNVFRAGNVIVRGNRIRNCAFTGVRGNAASNIQIEGNSISDMREVALYAEFGFEGALIANNTVDGAAIGVSVTNFNEGGRLAVVQGNIIRNLLPKRPAGTDPGDGAGIGIAVEADTAVTGNVIENAPTAGMMLGWGRLSARRRRHRQRDAQGRHRHRRLGRGRRRHSADRQQRDRRDASAAPSSAWTASAIVTGDLIKGGAERYANLTLTGNRVR